MNKGRMASSWDEGDGLGMWRGTNADEEEEEGAVVVVATRVMAWAHGVAHTRTWAR